MENNEIITNNEVVEKAAEEVVTTVASSEKSLKTVAEIGVTAALVGGLVYLGYRYVVKPWNAKRKARKEQDELTTATISEDGLEESDVENIDETE